MASNADHRGHNTPLSHLSRLEALRSRLKGVTHDSTWRRDEFRVSEPSHDNNLSGIPDDWDSDDGDNPWRHGEAAEDFDGELDGMEFKSVDVRSLLQELKERIETLESSMQEQERWKKEIDQAVDQLESLRKATEATAGGK